jgi:hypothetical protein
LLIYLDYRQRSHIDFKKLIGFALLLLFVWAGLIFLLLNDWPFARKTTLVIERQVLKLNVNGTDHSIPFADIKEIVVHTAGRLPWSAIVKWEIMTENDCFISCSLTISEFQFERFFFNKIRKQFVFMPIID